MQVARFFKEIALVVNRSIKFFLTLAFCALSAWPALAQGVRVEPKPLDAGDPQAKRAAVLVNQILAADKAGALKTVRAEGDAAFAKQANLEEIIDRQIARLGKAKYAISGFETGLGADVVVLLEAKDAPQTNLVVRYNDAKKIVGFAQVQTNEG